MSLEKRRDDFGKSYRRAVNDHHGFTSKENKKKRLTMQADSDSISKQYNHSLLKPKDVAKYREEKQNKKSTKESFIESVSVLL